MRNERELSEQQQGHVELPDYVGGGTGPYAALLLGRRLV